MSLLCSLEDGPAVFQCHLNKAGKDVLGGPIVSVDAGKDA